MEQRLKTKGENQVLIIKKGKKEINRNSSPVSVVVAEIFMQNIEEQALVTYSETLPLWLRYAEDTIAAVHKSKMMNSMNT